MQSYHGVIRGFICPFCRATAPDNVTDTLQQLNRRLEVNDPYAFYDIGAYYNVGLNVVQDKSKAFEYFIRVAELGSAMASNAAANPYNNGDVVEKDEKKVRHYLELAAMQGHNASRQNLG
jgi:TPR repeat protein